MNDRELLEAAKDEPPIVHGKTFLFTETEAESIIRMKVAAAVQPVRRHLENAHRNLELATGPAGARSALHEITGAIGIIDAIAKGKDG